jgi:L-histidine N-alpha-methyltransferase
MQDTRQHNTGGSQCSCIIVEPTNHVPDLAEDVIEGLLKPPRTLPPKYFYDIRGSQLFEQITATPEYYPTRTEDKLLASYCKDIIDKTRPDQILELGSGNSQKTRRLFNACASIDHACEYAPFDVCEPMLEETAEKLQSDYDWLTVKPLLGDYHAGLGNLPKIDGTRLFIFLGSTIGNFTPEETDIFFSEIRQSMQKGDYFLLGADRVKEKIVLDAAYNDAQGITADFNLNVLNVLNRELNANFKLNGFEHNAFYNESLNRIEMHLVSNNNQVVSFQLLDKQITIGAGEEILTELSYKYTFAELENIFDQCGLKMIRHYEPDNRYFSLILAVLQ